MPLMDLGLSSFEHVNAVVRDSVHRSIRHTWMCDWELVSFLDKINLVCDAPMYRMYCAEYDIYCDYTDEECVELAQKYKEQIYAFQYGLIKNLVCSVYDRWITQVRSDNVLPRLPGPARIAMLNFINIVKRMAESEYAPHFLGMFSSLAESHRESNSCTFDISDVQESITKDQFFAYCDIVKEMLSRPFKSTNENDAKLFNVRIILAQKVLMSILWMCEADHTTQVYSPDALFDRWILPYMQEEPAFKPYIAKYAARKGAPIAYAICVTPETIDCIPEDQDTYPITDTFRLMLTVLFVNNLSIQED